MKTTQATRVRAHLVELENELRALNLWSAQPPAPEALQSNEPFCVDTLSLSEWLQWLFIPRMHALIEGHHDLPSQCDISTIAQESFKTTKPAPVKLLACIEALDQTIALKIQRL